MRVWYWCAFLLVLVLAAPAAADPIGDLIGGVAARYGQAKNMMIDFEQVAIVKQLGGREKKANGTIYFARPNKIRWVYKSAPAKEIISDGTSLVVYYVEEKKAYLDKAGRAFNISEPVKLLTGEIDVKTLYAAELLGEEDGAARLKLTPKKAMGFAYLVLHINKQGFFVQRVDTVDAYGNLTKLYLKNPRFNTKLPAGTFVFTPREGVEIIDAPMMDEL